MASGAVTGHSQRGTEENATCRRRGSSKQLKPSATTRSSCAPVPNAPLIRFAFSFTRISKSCSSCANCRPSEVSGSAISLCSKQGRRSIDLDPETLAVLKLHRKRQAEERLTFGPGYAESELVFRSQDGTPVIPHLFTLAFKKAVKDAGLPTIRLHDLRHTHVALLARAGIPAKVIQERVGHHSAGFTLDNYGGTFPSQHKDAAQKFAALVRG